MRSSCSSSVSLPENDQASVAAPGSRSLALSLALVPSLLIAGGLHAETVAAPEGSEKPVPKRDADKDVVELDPLEIQGRSEQAQLSSPKFTQPLVDVPQTFSVVPQEVFAKQSATTLSDVLRNTPGVTFLAGEGGNASSADGDSFFMRGFDTSGSIFIDGVRDTAQLNRDVYNVEQVEIAKGPAGSDVGRSTASGYINLATKSPQAEAFQRGSLSYGFDETDAESRRRATFDINQPLGTGESPGVAFRLNGLFQDGGVTGRDVAEQNRWALAPSVAFGLGTATRLTLAYERFEQHDLPEYGLPLAAYPDNGVYTPAAPAIEQDTFFGNIHDHDDAVSDRFTARVEHDFTPDTRITNLTRYTEVERKTVYTTPGNNSGSYNAGTGLLTRARQANERENESFANLTNVTTAFSTGKFEHSLVAGLEVLKERQFTRSFTSYNLAPTPVTAPDTTSPIAEPAPSGATSEGEIKTVALYAFDTIELSEAWILTGGLRWEHYSADYVSVGTTVLGNPVTRTDVSDSILSWKGGIVYKPRANGSLYAAYGKSIRPPGTNFTVSTNATNADNIALRPQEADNYEIGTKWEFFQRRLSTNLAVFRTENSNVATTDSGSGQVVQTNDQTVEGVEFSVSGRITENWLVYGGVAHMKSEFSAPSFTAGGGTDGASLQWTPEWSGNIWTTYRLPFGLTVGGGAQYMDEVSRQTTNTPSATMPTIPDYWLFNGLLEYAVNDHVSFRFNVNNLFDKEYIGSLNNNGGRYNPGAGRSYVISADFSF